MRWRRAPQLSSTEVAGVELVVAPAAQWSCLPFFPVLTWDPNLRETKVAEAPRNQAAIYAGSEERFFRADADDLEVRHGRACAATSMNQAELKHRWRPSNSGFQQQQY